MSQDDHSKNITRKELFLRIIIIDYKFDININIYYVYGWES